MRKKIFLVLLAMLTTAGSVLADIGISKGLFERGRFRASASGALGTAFNEDYFVLGLGLGYYLADGLELGVNGEAWTGNDPGIYKLRPQLTYVFTQGQRLMPYVGAFYQRTYFESFPDLDSYGGRAGIFTSIGGRGYAGAGLVYEKYVDCNETIYDSCDSTYPEFMIGASF